MMPDLRRGPRRSRRACPEVGDLGGSVLVPPSPTPKGTRAVLADPQFAVFGVIGVIGGEGTRR
ncbi:hypothetical protein AB0395_05310 [Streptosporangium sp. NPDC051023]|uniref:hypothetical protein n=1 Tax=Streptosporangium sp. NPDC051023 TaxID=3155410 RepID=UPI00344D8E37